jgi:hypothetical protein
MKLIVLFGGASRDAIAQYAISKGATVEPWIQRSIEDIQMPETKEEYAGGNNTFPSLRGVNGEDLYKKVTGKSLKYSNRSDQTKAINSLEEKLEDYLKEMAFSKGGPFKNGMLNPAQLGGYNIGSMKVNGFYTRSLKGLKIEGFAGGKDYIIENDILVIELPHPSSLSRTVVEHPNGWDAGRKAASARVMQRVGDLFKYRDELGWKIDADKGLVNNFQNKKDYDYGRTDIGPEYYDFGTPKNRMVSRSSAVRLKTNVVIIGTRDRANFPTVKIKKLTEAAKPTGLNENNLFTARPSVKSERYAFDPGPWSPRSSKFDSYYKIRYAKLMKENLDLNEILAPKEGKSFKTDGIAAYNVKTHPDVADFGHYRGTFIAPKVIILADPHGYDGIATARALTGERGQHLHSLMDDLGIGDQYLVIKTVPFGMDGANASEWETVLGQTATYRKELVDAVLADNEKRPLFVIADGKYAATEAQKLFKSHNINVFTARRSNTSHSQDILDLAKSIKTANASFKNKTVTGQMKSIPRSHLSYYARVWEGTSGDRVITSGGKKYQGMAFAVIVPKWAVDQFAPKSIQGDVGEKLLEVIEDQKLRLPYESFNSFMKREKIDPYLGFLINTLDYLLKIA